MFTNFGINGLRIIKKCRPQNLNEFDISCPINYPVSHSPFDGM